MGSADPFSFLGGQTKVEKGELTRCDVVVYNRAYGIKRGAICSRVALRQFESWREAVYVQLNLP